MKVGDKVVVLSKAPYETLKGKTGIIVEYDAQATTPVVVNMIITDEGDGFSEGWPFLEDELALAA